MTNLRVQKESLLQTAARIGTRLCETAVWDEQESQCNWLGRRDIEDATIAQFSVRSAALSPELYSGSSGVALFLIELYGRTGDAQIGRTAQAALRRSIAYMQHSPTPASPISFYAGHLGMAYAVCRLMDVDPSADFEGERAWLQNEIVAATPKPHHFDIIAGSAGAIPPLLWLAKRPGLQMCADLAVTLGNELRRTAPWRQSLPTGQADAARPYPRTGYSHGASGIALALLSLYAHSGDLGFRSSAREAFAVEDALFSQNHGNWLDTRFPHTRENETWTGTFQTAWCHGAPGIALARMHAQDLDPAQADHHAAMAAVAIGTARTALEQRLELPGFDATLCHGLTGLSEILWTYGERVDDPDCRALALQTAEELARRYDAAGNWPSGINAGGPSPSLMIGSAGVGYHFLRLHAPKEVPPILAVLP